MKSIWSGTVLAILLTLGVGAEAGGFRDSYRHEHHHQRQDHHYRGGDHQRGGRHNHDDRHWGKRYVHPRVQHHHHYYSEQRHGSSYGGHPRGRHYPSGVNGHISIHF